MVIAVNGYELSPEDPYSQEALKAMSRRPAILDVQWPEDQRLPVVKHA